MFQSLKAYWQSFFGGGTAGERAQPEVRRYEPRQSMPARDESALRETLMVGLRLFHAGHRQEAIPALKHVLASPLRVPSYRLTAAGLLAETHRGLGDFVTAEQFYRLSIDESEAVLPDERRGNEWYEHYRPRAQLGLVTVLRRTLSSDHERFRSLLRIARDEFASYPALDLMAQLNAVEGLYFRQLGDIEGAIERLKEGIEGIRDVDPPYLFLHPEHFEALLVLAYLCSPSATLMASRMARDVLKAERGPWSTAVAAAGLLHLRLRRIDTEQPANGIDKVADQKQIDELLEVLADNARFEGDPLLLTEEVMLCLACNIAGQKQHAAAKCVDRLAELWDDLPQPLVALRAVELGSLAAPMIAVDCFPPTAETLLERGRVALEKLRGQLASYGCEARLQDQWYAILRKQVAPTTSLACWNSEPLQHLRARIWP